MMWCFDTCITITKPVCTSVTLHFLFVVRKLETYSKEISNIQNITNNCSHQKYIRSLEFINFIMFVIFDCRFPVGPPFPHNYHSMLCYYEFKFLRFYIYLRFYHLSICHSISGLFYLAECPLGCLCEWKTSFSSKAAYDFIFSTFITSSVDVH